MTLSEAAYNIINLLRAGQSTNSEPVSLEQIKFNILYYRALLLRRDADRGANLLPFEQTVPVEIDLVDPEYPLPSGSLFQENYFDGANVTLARSSRKLPVPVRLKLGEAVSYIGHSFHGGNYPLVQVSQAAPLLHGKYTGHLKRAFFSDDYLYLQNPSLETGENEIDVRAVFEHPRKAHDFGVEERATIDNTDVALSDYWDDDSTPFPCPLDFYQRLVQAIVSGELKILSSTELDRSLNENP